MPLKNGLSEAKKEAEDTEGNRRESGTPKKPEEAARKAGTSFGTEPDRVVRQGNAPASRR